MDTAAAARTTGTGANSRDRIRPGTDRTSTTSRANPTSRAMSAAFSMALTRGGGVWPRVGKPGASVARRPAWMASAVTLGA